MNNAHKVYENCQKMKRYKNQTYAIKRRILNIISKKLHIGILETLDTTISMQIMVYCNSHLEINYFDAFENGNKTAHNILNLSIVSFSIVEKEVWEYD